MKKPDKFLEELAGVFHAGTGMANLVISYYNFRKGNKIRALIHIIVAGYEGKCFHEHWEEIRKG